MSRYVETVNGLAPGWQSSAGGGQGAGSSGRSGGGAMGPVFSCMAGAQEAEAAPNPLVRAAAWFMWRGMGVQCCKLR